MTATPTRRLPSVDVLRGLAIALALFQHSLTTFGVWPSLTWLQRALVRVAADVATPAFVLVFGIMLELIYVPRVARDGWPAVTRSLLRRAGDCYLTYVATIVAAVLSGRRSVAHGLAAALLLGNTRYGNILKFYALALPLAILLLRLRFRWGLALVVGCGAGAWVLAPALAVSGWPDDAAPLSYLTATLVGYPAGRSWLSLLHSLPIIVAGMLLGHLLATGRAAGTLRSFHRAVALLLVPCLLIVAEKAIRVGGLQLSRGYLSLTFRSAHDVVYYALGLGQTMVALVVLTWLWPPGTATSARFRPLLALGQRSLLTFTVGSCILNAWPPAWTMSPAIGLVLSAALPVAMAILAVRSTDRARIV